MLNNKFIIAIIAIVLVIGLVVGGVFIFINNDDQPDNPDNTDTTPPDTDVPSDTIKVEDETKPGISPTPFVDIEEGNEIYFDADVVE